jgi:predicted CoA-binding protein
MSVDGLTNNDIRGILSRPRRVALVGASDKPDRASYGVLKFLVDHGFDVVPVNPRLAGQAIHGCVVVASLDEAVPLDLVDVFRAPGSVGPVVEDAVRLGARTIWLQLGVVNQVAADEARRAGLMVAMDRCPKIEFARLGLA